VDATPDTDNAAPDCAPLVTIGMPVYNGERYITRALDSFLTQTFSDFEVVVSDNGSTDATAAIVQDYAARDPRIRYVPSDRNRGATWNFNRVVELARGKYFRWASHDDTIEPEYLRSCVTVLEQRHDAVLCSTDVHSIDAEGVRTEFDRTPIPLDSERADLRFGGFVMHADRCHELFGLTRLEALRSIPPLGDYGNADGVLLARLALLGKFVLLPERLLNMRVHPGQSMSVYGAYGGEIDYRGWSEWWNPDVAGDLLVPHWRRLFEHLRSTVVVPGLTLRTRVRCVAPIAHWAFRFRHRLVADGIHAARVRLASLR
jgi:glycosyltransferase involved in cell wall biosynthesis